MGREPLRTQQRVQYDLDPRGVGWKGFKKHPAPIIIAAVMSAYVLIYIIWIHRDFVDYVTFFDRMDKLVYGILASLSSALSYKFFKRISFREIGLRNSVFLLLATVFALSALLLPTLQTKMARDIAAMVTISSLLAAIVWALLSTTIVNLVSQLFGPQIDNYPPRASNLPWMMDLAVWIFLTITTLLIVSVFIQSSDDGEQHLPLYPWLIAASVCFVYQWIGTSLFGGTIGQRVCHVRILMQITGARLSLLYSLFRTLIVTAPALSIFTLVYLDSIDSVSHVGGIGYYSVYAAIVVFLIGMIVGGFSMVLIRTEHPRGQGVVDLLLRTISVPYAEQQESEACSGS